MKTEDGRVELSDGSILKLKITIIDAREIGFSPFGGIDIAVKTTGGIAPIDVTQEIRNEVADKPIAPRSPKPPRDGWEIIDIIDYKPAYAEENIETSKGLFKVKVIAEPVMASRNVNYRTEFGEPIYWLNWVYKISWKPVKEEGNVS